MGKILKYWTKEEILKALNNLPKNKLLTTTLIKQYQKENRICYIGTIYKKLNVNSLKEVCNIANLKCGALYGKEKMKKMQQLNFKYTKDKINKLLRKHSLTHTNLTPTNFIYSLNRENNLDIRNSVIKYYNNYEQALKSNNILYKKYRWNKKEILTNLKYIHKTYGPLCKYEINNLYTKKNLLPKAKTMKDIFNLSLEEIMKLVGLEFVLPIEKGHPYNGKIGKRETKVLNKLEKEKNIKIKRQHRIEIGSRIIFLDGYDMENNIVYEVDEELHKYSKMEDKQRDNLVKGQLNCKIVRIKI